MLSFIWLKYLKGLLLMKSGTIRFFKFSISLFLCAVFILLSVAVPFYYSITALTKPKYITKVIQNIDYKKVIKETPALESTLQQNGINTAAAEDFIESEVGGELIEIYTDEATKILLSIPENEKLDIPLIKAVANENIDKFVKITEDITKKNYSEEKIKNNVNNYIDKNETQIVETIPVIETTRKVVRTVYESNVIEETLSLKFAILLAVVGIVLISLVFVINKKSGLIWMGVSCFITSGFLATILYFSKSDLIRDLAVKMSTFNSEIIESATSICSEKIAIAFYSMVSLTFFFFLFFMFVKILINIDYIHNAPLSETASISDSEIDIENTETNPQLILETEEKSQPGL